MVLPPPHLPALMPQMSNVNILGADKEVIYLFWCTSNFAELFLSIALLKIHLCEMQKEMLLYSVFGTESSGLTIN